MLALRVVVGGFLIWGVWDNVQSADRMAEFAGFLAQHGFAMPELMAPLSVWAQLLCGLAFVLGLFTRWAGVVCAFNFIVALIMVDAALGVRGAFPATMLVLVGFCLATLGAGSFSVDAALTRAPSK
ncbi:MAG TPA: DoxX family protein [Vitreimonas sp.]|uniref:DoxX family protein n=1 Tax=Vitreimonas sp. TaxID=3069702 RepID=UPI002D65F4FF|nr:DoxX family protein [Vitreimonas sp.]HYD89599.1 DoxX family protein [Vitreimonas sp.]